MKIVVMEASMNRLTIVWGCLYTVLVIFNFLGCASGPGGKLIRVENPAEDELCQNWKEYTVFSLRSNDNLFNLSLLYKIKNDRRIILDSRWIEVSSEDTMANSIVSQSAWVMEIFGSNDEIFGYMVLRTGDRASVKIIDQNTVQLYYHRIGYLN